MVRSIGLTGGIGSGKSVVARTLVECGAWLVDTDAIARALTLPGGAALPALAAEFGPELITADGALDRERMRAIAFGDAQAKRSLEAILHPMIGAEAVRQAGLAAGRVVVLDVPLLVESGRWRARAERILVVDCSESTQVERVVRRSGWSPEAVRAAIAQQATRAQRRACADAVLFNDGIAPAELEAALHALWVRWQDQWLGH